MERAVFVYGTLRDPVGARQVLGHADFGRDATLVGLRRVQGTYPTLAPGGETDGRILHLHDGDLNALDRYEGVDRDLYARVRIPSRWGRDGEAGDLWTYVGDPDALGVDVEWPGDESLEQRVKRYLADNEVYLER